MPHPTERDLPAGSGPACLFTDCLAGSAARHAAGWQAGLCAWRVGRYRTSGNTGRLVAGCMHVLSLVRRIGHLAIQVGDRLLTCTP